MDAKKEIEHLDKHDEIASQFDYSHSQVNDVQQLPQQPAATTNPQTPPPSSNTQPVQAKTNRLRIVIGVISAIVILVPLISSQLWLLQNKDQYNKSIEAIIAEGRVMKAAADQQNMADLRQSCERISGHAAKLGNLSEYPVAEIQAKLAQGRQKLESGMSSCLVAIDNDSVDAANKMKTDVSEGMALLNDAIKKINNGGK